MPHKEPAHACRDIDEIVAANRELIARFEKKIQATLAEVWGEEDPTAMEK